MREGVQLGTLDSSLPVSVSQTRFRQTPPFLLRALGVSPPVAPVPAAASWCRTPSWGRSRNFATGLPVVAPERVPGSPGAGDRGSGIRKRVKDRLSTHPNFSPEGILVGDEQNLQLVYGHSCATQSND